MNNYEIGDKVVPFKKEPQGRPDLHGLARSPEWKKAKKKQGFLYVVAVPRVKDGLYPDGDFFDESDFKPYEK